MGCAGMKREVVDGAPATGVPILPSHVMVDDAATSMLRNPYADVRKVSPDGTMTESYPFSYAAYPTTGS